MKKMMIMMLGSWYVLFNGLCAAAEQIPAIVEADVRAVLAAEREGVLTELKVDSGDPVKKGDVLASVYYYDLILLRKQHEANGRFLKDQVENLSRLNAKGLSTDENLAKARMEVEINEIRIRSISNQIAHSMIKAPFSGKVVARHVQPHEWVKPGQPVVEIYDPMRLRITTDIPVSVAFKLKNNGQGAEFYFPGIDQPIIAKLDRIAPEADVRSNTVKVYWTIASTRPQAGRLMPGMRGELRLDN